MAIFPVTPSENQLHLQISTRRLAFLPLLKSNNALLNPGNKILAKLLRLGSQ